MKTTIQAAVKVLIEMATSSEVKSHEALQFTQAALNLAHVLVNLDAAK